MNKIFHFVLTVILLLSLPNFAQEEEHSSEINSSVPELFDFHEIIYPIWHTAYPEKDYAMLKDMVSDVNAGAEKIYSAELPGILRDKKEEWNSGVQKFRSSVNRYNTAMEGDEEEEMLMAAEELHSDFEMLVRIIRPVTKEVDEFHKVLYMIYHHYWPDKNISEFNNAVDELSMRAEELYNCVLPKWAEQKTNEFKAQTEKLFISTNGLKELKNEDNVSDADIEKAIEIVHDNYMALEALFDE